MKIYVGRWDLLPEEWEGYNGFCEKSENEIFDEVVREIPLCKIPNYIGVFDADEFEDTFNLSLTHFIDSKDYWIKIF